MHRCRTIVVCRGLVSVTHDSQTRVQKEIAISQKKKKKTIKYIRGKNLNGDQLCLGIFMQILTVSNFTLHERIGACIPGDPFDLKRNDDDILKTINVLENILFV